MTNRPADATQPGPADVAERNQLVIQHPAITEPTSLWGEQRFETQLESVDDSHLLLLRLQTRKVRSWLSVMPGGRGLRPLPP